MMPIGLQTHDAQASIERIRQLASTVRHSPSIRPFEKNALRVLLSVIAAPSTPVVVFLAGCRAAKVAICLGDHRARFLSELDSLVRAFDRQITHDGLRQIIENARSSLVPMPATRDLAVRWQMSGREVSRLTTSELGVGVGALRVAVRCRQAVVLVLTTEERISQIAYSCGYEHVSQLDHDFDRLLGRTPRALRQSVGLDSLQINQQNQQVFGIEVAMPTGQDLPHES